MITLLKSATIIDASSPHHQKKKDILIVDGKISQIAKDIPTEKHYQIIQLDNLHVSCGWFDTSVCFGEPGYEERETVANGLKAASKSGFTAVAVNPNTQPYTDSKADIQFLINKANNNATELFPIGALTQEAKGIEMAELFDMQQSGAIAFGDYGHPIQNDKLMSIALLYAQNFDGLVMSFPSNSSISGEGSVNEGKNSTKLGFKGAPSLAEEMQIIRDIYLLEYTGGKLHIPTISTVKSVELIKNAKEKGFNITCSVAAHHLCLTDDELEGFDSNFKVNPPLRTEEDRQALIQGLKDGVIDILTSDHNPIDIENKKLEFGLAKFGTIGLESLFGAANSVLDLETFTSSISENPRRIFGLESITVQEGQTANLTLFNPSPSVGFGEENILSTSKNSAFLNKKLKGKVYGIYSKQKLILD